MTAPRLVPNPHPFDTFFNLAFAIILAIMSVRMTHCVIFGNFFKE